MTACHPPRPRVRAGVAYTVAAMLTVALPASVPAWGPAPLAAQPATQTLSAADASAGAARNAGVRRSRKLTMTIGGALVGTAISVAYDRLSLGGQRQIGCSPRGCALPYLVSVGAIAGFFAGYEMDQQFALRYRTAPPASFVGGRVSIDGDGIAMAAFDTLLAVVGSRGIAVLSAGVRFEPLATRATGFAGMADVAFLDGGRSLAVAAASGLSELPTISGRGRLRLARPIDAVAATPRGVAVASGDRVTLVAPDDSLNAAPEGAAAWGPVRALVWDDAREGLWVATDSGVEFHVPDAAASWKAMARIETAGPVRRLALGEAGRVLLLAEGNRGVERLALEGLTVAARARWNATPYVYDVLPVRGGFVVAAGSEGVYRMEVSEEGELLPTGLSRDAGFALAFARTAGRTFVLDRTGRAVVELDLPE